MPIVRQINIAIIVVVPSICVAISRRLVIVPGMASRHGTRRSDSTAVITKAATTAAAIILLLLSSVEEVEGEEEVEDEGEDEEEDEGVSGKSPREPVCKLDKQDGRQSRECPRKIPPG